MSKWSHHEEALPEGTRTISATAWDDAEKGLYDSTPTLPVVSQPSPAHLLDEKKAAVIETYTTADVTVAPPARPPPPAKKKPAGPKPSKWILFQLWFNTYRKFFTFVTLLNLTGIVLAACNRFPYAENHLGALVLGNLLMAVLMRNELFLRFLYIISIYGLRSVSCLTSYPTPSQRWIGTDEGDCFSGHRIASRSASPRFCSTSAASTRGVLCRAPRK